MADNDPAAIADEVGDLLFAAVNLARHLKEVDPETALRNCQCQIRKAIPIYRTGIARDTHRPMESCTLEELDAPVGVKPNARKNVSNCG